MNPILKPKNFKIHVPGHGVIERENFTETHLQACVKQVSGAGLNVDDYLKKHFTIASYGNFPLFAEPEQTEEQTEQPEEPATTKKRKKKSDEAE